MTDLESILHDITRLDGDLVQLMGIFDRYLEDRGFAGTRADIEHRRRGDIARLRSVIADFRVNLKTAFSDRAKQATVDVGSQMRQILNDVTPDGVGRSWLDSLAKIKTRT